LSSCSMVVQLQHRMSWSTWVYTSQSPWQHRRATRFPWHASHVPPPCSAALPLPLLRSCSRACSATLLSLTCWKLCWQATSLTNQTDAPSPPTPPRPRRCTITRPRPTPCSSTTSTRPRRRRLWVVAGGLQLCCSFLFGHIPSGREPTHIQAK